MIGVLFTNNFAAFMMARVVAVWKDPGIVAEWLRRTLVVGRVPGSSSGEPEV